MKLEVNLSKKSFFILLGAILVLAGAIYVNAQDPAIFGHDVSEIGGISECVDGRVLTYLNGEFSCVTISSDSSVLYGGSFMIRGNYLPGCVTANLITGDCTCPEGYSERRSSTGGYYHFSPWDSYYLGYFCEKVNN